ncbi:hypothetical protein EGO53_11575 [Serratia liquefaciens]|uniref:Uncharacterized protein n=1 Tax=Serratia liquefaciens TaxID=614 RepID=A0A515CW68_SERLI|nr:hypothetical protein EGO53_11575 [Serratia liquefaciens]
MRIPMNVLHLAKEIERELISSDRPEFTLFQRYEASSEGQRKVLVLSMIGKLIEMDRRLRMKAPC